MPETFLRANLRLFLVFLYLGRTSFGGPAAHLGYFRRAFVNERKWFTEQQYADLIALCQFMPGPASSQVGLSVSLLRGGYAGALAVWQMGRQFCRYAAGWILMFAACAVTLLFHGIAPQIMVMLATAAAGAVWMDKDAAAANRDTLPNMPGRKAGLAWLALFAALFAVLPWLAAGSPASLAALADALYRTGALVFGGGHVGLPVLQSQTVPLWLDKHTFLAGYGAAQAVPGPLFTLAAFLGAAANPQQAWLWGAVATAAVFLPSFLMVFGLLPFWSDIALRPHHVGRR